MISILGKRALFVIAALLFCMAPAPSWAQRAGELLIVGDWYYSAQAPYHVSHSGQSEADVTGAVASDPGTFIYGCGGGPLSPYTDWDDPAYTRSWFDGIPTAQDRHYNHPIKARDTDVHPCQQTIDNGATGGRVRSVDCPPGSSWNPAVHLCTHSGTPFFDADKNHLTCGTNTNKTNPIHCATGEKLQAENDFASPASPWLRFVRYYGSSSSFPGSLLSKHWRHSFSHRLVVVSRLVNGVQVEQGLRAARPDGTQYQFILNSSGGYDHDTDVNMTLIRNVDGGGHVTGWRLATDSETFENYDASGLLSSIEDRNGTQLTLAYSGSQLSSVTDRQGRSLVFGYALLGTGVERETRLVTLLLPDGQLIQYGYNANFHLSRVTYPDDTPNVPGDNPHRDYVYNEGSTSSDTGLLTGIVDENGHRYATWRYDASNRGVLSVHGDVNDLADRVEITYTGNYAVSAKEYSNATDYVTRTVNNTIVNGVAKHYSVDKSCASCGVSFLTMTYDANGNRDLVTDFNGTLTDYDYDSRNLESQRIDAKSTSGSNNPPEKRTIQTDWHATFRLPVERRTYNANGVLEAKTNWTYNSRGQVLTQTQADPAPGSTATRTTTTSYCEQADITAGTCPLLGLITRIDGPRTDKDDITTFTYYPSTDETGCAGSTGECHRIGDLWKVSRKVSQSLSLDTLTLRYDRAGRPTRTQDANGVITEMAYWPRGWLKSRTIRGSIAAEDATTAIAYDAVGQVSRVTLPDGSFTSYTYDSAHRLTDIADNLSNRIHYTLDAGGNRIAEDTKDPAGDITRTLGRVYDTLGQLHQSLNAAGTVTATNIYDPNRNLLTVTDTNNILTENSYDPLNRLVKTIQDKGNGGIQATTQYAYDSRDNLRQVTDPKSLPTVYTYDGLNNLTDLDSPDTGHTHYTYDAAGNRSSQTDARLVTASFAYDALNRLQSVTYPTSSLNTTYDYDQADAVTGCFASFPKGRLTRITDSSGTTTYCYDRHGNVSSKTQVTGSSTFVVQYTYDAADRVQTVTYPSGRMAVLGRDAVGRINQVISEGASQGPMFPRLETSIVDDITYYPFGPLANVSFSSGRTLSKVYDGNYWITQVFADTGHDFELNYAEDELGNITSIGGPRGRLGVTNARNYEYDRLYRLKTVKDQTGATLESYGYDATGDRLTESIGGSTLSYGYGPNDHHLTSYGSAARAYDANGNTRQVDVAGNSPIMVYDDRNRLAARTNGSNGPLLTGYRYNGRGERVAKLSYDGSAANNVTDTHRYVYDEAGHLIGEYAASGALVQEIVWIDSTPIARYTDDQGGTQYIETDHLGTPRNLVDPDRNTVVWKWDLIGPPAAGVSVAFGESAPSTDPDGDGTATVFNLRYPGQQYDVESGLSYNYFRDYEPGTGRYVESDPIGLRGGIDTFAYVGGFPLILIDQYGWSSSCGSCCSGVNWRVSNGSMQTGTVRCCGGVATVCLNPHLCDGLPSDACKILQRCARKHEEMHRDLHLNCPDSNPVPAMNGNFTGQEDIECDAFTGEVSCIDISQCSSSECVRKIRDVQDYKMKQKKKNCSIVGR